MNTVTPCEAGVLDGKAFTAAAFIFYVRVVETEKAVQPFVNVIDFAAVEHLERVRRNINARTVGFKMDIAIRHLVGEIQYIAIAGAAAGLDGNAQAQALSAFVQHLLICWAAAGVMLSVAIEASSC